MNPKTPSSRRIRTFGILASLAVSMTLAVLLGRPLFAHQQQTPPPPPPQTYEPTVGMAGKDVVWVPTSPEMVEKMLDLAKVTPQDLVMDLGSGDGRNIIAAAKRGARAIGVEYNPELVELSRKKAKEAGVADKASFVQGDMYEADISKATVMALFLLTTNLEKLQDKFLALKPGSRIALNTFTIPGWEPEIHEKVGGECTSWCDAYLLIVPAKVAGLWKSDRGDFNLTQQFTAVSGTISSGGKNATIDSGKVKADQISFTAAGTTYTGKVDGDRIVGTAAWGTMKQSFTATKTK
jgi:precorrin-6B methylase 2